MKRIAVGISGASGAIYGIRFLELLRGLPGVESHLIISDAARRTIVEETIDQEVRRTLASYSRPVPEGSAEWEILYQKTREEVLKRRFRL